MPSKVTLVSVILLYSVNLYRLYPKLKKKHKKLLLIMIIGLIVGIYYHSTSKKLLLDMFVVLLMLYLFYKEVPSIKKYIIGIISLALFARFINYRYGQNKLQSFITVCVHFIGALTFNHVYNKIEE